MGVTNSAESQTIIHGLTKAQLQHELASRGIFNDGNKTQQQGYLAKEICGKPALRYNNPMTKLQGLGLQDYEILPTELLHVLVLTSKISSRNYHHICLLQKPKPWKIQLSCALVTKTVRELLTMEVH